MKAAQLVAAVVLLVSVGSTRPIAAPTIGAVTIRPSSIPVNTPTAVTLATVITDAALIPGSVNLQRLNANTRVFQPIGTLQDDGTNSGRFAIQLTFTESAPFPVTLRVSAAFRGLLTRVFSPETVLNVTR